MSYLSHLANKRVNSGSRSSTYPENLTEQQSAVANCNPDGMVKVNAFAGTGKTHSLIALAHNRQHLRSIYLCFNKSAQLDASKRFPTTRCTSIHGLAFGAQSRPMTYARPSRTADQTPFSGLHQAGN